MDNKSKILLWVWIVVILGSIGFTFYKTIVQHDYLVIDTGTLEEDEGDTVEPETE